MYSINTSIRSTAHIQNVSLEEEIQKGTFHPYFLLMRSKLNEQFNNAQVQMYLPRVRAGSLEFEVLFNLTFQSLEAFIFAVNVLQGGSYLEKQSEKTIREIYGRRVLEVESSAEAQASCEPLQGKTPRDQLIRVARRWAFLVAIVLLAGGYLAIQLVNESKSKRQNKDLIQALADMSTTIDSQSRSNDRQLVEDHPPVVVVVERLGTVQCGEEGVVEPSPNVKIFK